jgi:hypothetical protein
MFMKKAGIAGVLILFLLSFSACGPTRVIRVQTPPDSNLISPKAKFLKVYMNDGSLYVLDEWIIDDKGNTVTGTGRYFGIKRNLVSFRTSAKDIQSDVYEICQDDITLVETNQLKNHIGNMAQLTLVGVPLGLLSLYCVIDPKACFGSCPTFYTLNNNMWQLVAEGFSSSILPVFEKSDIDMLYWSKNSGRSFDIKLTNEALETHAIRYANIMAFPAKEGNRVFATSSGEFWYTENITAPAVCSAAEGDCLPKVEKMDHTERYSTAGSKNLAEKEVLYFSFDNTNSRNPGLLIGSRQTLLTTYLFYQGLAYTGNYTGYYMSGIENGNEALKNRVMKLWDKLGGIEIYLKNAKGKWELIETIEEMGPIAADVHLVKLPHDIPDKASFKLKMTRGLWRIDYLSLAVTGEKAEPIVLHPETVRRNEVADSASLQLLNDTTRYLVTFPGDTYYLKYNLPEDRDYELFLNSKGYYLEWMRDEWLAEENLLKARLMFAFPGMFMRRTAKAFKKSEAEMEDIFWGSRYVQN